MYESKNLEPTLSALCVSFGAEDCNFWAFDEVQTNDIIHGTT